MARRIARGEIWMLQRPAPDKLRPVLVLSRPVLLDVLATATVAAVTSARRGSPTEVDLDEEDGLKHASSVNLANVYTVRQSELRRFVGFVAPRKMAEVCRALAVAFGCD